ncbi:hypothetical protein ACIPPS_00895 [Streptomyces sp. NPDC090127]|uniref:hypothetical protein n=1 Tax=Streptomyces sp. NPDC090127 TaxID=3365953 RepID=UPI003822308C
MVVALGLAVALVALLRGGDGDGGGSASSPRVSSPGVAAEVPDEAARAKAQTLAAGVAMDAPDWGPGYERAEQYQNDPAPELEVKSSCEIFDQTGRKGTLAAVRRSVRQPTTGLLHHTEVRVFADAATAESYMSDVESGTRRCQEQTSGKVRFADVRQAGAPDVAGYDAIVAEDGRQVTDENGAKSDYPYVLYTGRSGAATLSVFAFGEAAAGQAPLTERATGALQKLQRRLEAASR